LSLGVTTGLYVQLQDPLCPNTCPYYHHHHHHLNKSYKYNVLYKGKGKGKVSSVLF